ncbi:hypothetical protein pb186bvf_020735 [Paramecium bursaria]
MQDNVNIYQFILDFQCQLFISPTVCIQSNNRQLREHQFMIQLFTYIIQHLKTQCISCLGQSYAELQITLSDQIILFVCLILGELYQTLRSILQNNEILEIFMIQKKLYNVYQSFLQDDSLIDIFFNFFLQYIITNITQTK